MNYSINDEDLLRVDSSGRAVVRAELWAASENDLPAYDAIPDRILAEGSAAVVPGESKLYLLDFDRTWKEWGGE